MSCLLDYALFFNDFLSATGCIDDVVQEVGLSARVQDLDDKVNQNSTVALRFLGQYLQGPTSHRISFMDPWRSYVPLGCTQHHLCIISCSEFDIQAVHV